jgi:hypothetical protein
MRFLRIRLTLSRNGRGHARNEIAVEELNRLEEEFGERNGQRIVALVSAHGRSKFVLGFL